jgi:hypothetical protein
VILPRVYWGISGIIGENTIFLFEDRKFQDIKCRCASVFFGIYKQLSGRILRTPFHLEMDRKSGLLNWDALWSRMFAGRGTLHLVWLFLAMYACLLGLSQKTNHTIGQSRVSQDPVFIVISPGVGFYDWDAILAKGTVNHIKSSKSLIPISHGSDLMAKKICRKRISEGRIPKVWLECIS